VAVEASPLLGVWHMTTVALFFVIGAIGVLFGYMLGWMVGVLSRRTPDAARNRLDALDQMNRVKRLLDRGELGSAARELGISDKQANTWTFDHLSSQVEVRLQSLAKRAVG